MEGCQPFLEQAPLGVVVDECQRAEVGIPCLRDAPQAAKQLGARRVQVMEVLERNQPGVCRSVKVVFIVNTAVSPPPS